MNRSLFTPFCKVFGQETRQNRKLTNILILLLGIMTLSGCVTSKKTHYLAPSPPEISISDIQTPSTETDYVVPLEAPLSVMQANNIQKNDAFVIRDDVEDVSQTKPKVAVSQKKCRIKDRFDRKATIAYEWGRERLSVDMDGIVSGGSGDSGMKVQYTMRLQNHVPKKQLCRYSSNWQGLIGSSYNEMFMRKDDTMWDDLREMRKSATDYMREHF